jgi:hypothetical protein
MVDLQALCERMLTFHMPDSSFSVEFSWLTRVFVCRDVAVVCDESKLAPLVSEYTKTMEKVKDITDEWVGAMRAGSEATDKSRKYIKRKRVKLAMLPGALGKATGGMVGGADKGVQEHFGKDAQDADELEYNMFKMKQLLQSIRVEQDSTRRNVRPASP